MAELICDISMSLDGFGAGPDPSLEEPLGEGGDRLHQWAYDLETWRQPHGLSGGTSGNPDAEIVAETVARAGATIMGRRMFGGGDGPWDESWRGWWGEEPPFHHPVFVLTHQPREPLVMEGTTFTFVTDGIESALEQARAAAAGRGTWPWAAGPRQSSSTCGPGCWTSSRCTWSRSCSAGAPGCSTGSARPAWRSSGRSSPRPSPTSATGWSASRRGA